MSEENTCRICRCEGTPDDPLFHPCKCRGSIKYMHQECLISWLEHSKKESCDICHTPYTFKTIYDESAPDRVPLSLILRKMGQQLVSVLYGVFIGLVTLTTVIIQIPVFVKCKARIFNWLLGCPIPHESLLFSLLFGEASYDAKDLFSVANLETFFFRTYGEGSKILTFGVVLTGLTLGVHEWVVKDEGFVKILHKKIGPEPQMNGIFRVFQQAVARDNLDNAQNRFDVEPEEQARNQELHLAAGNHINGLHDRLRGRPAQEEEEEDSEEEAEPRVRPYPDHPGVPAGHFDLVGIVDDEEDPERPARALPPTRPDRAEREDERAARWQNIANRILRPPDEGVDLLEEMARLQREQQLQRLRQQQEQREEEERRRNEGAANNDNILLEFMLTPGFPLKVAGFFDLAVIGALGTFYFVPSLLGMITINVANTVAVMLISVLHSLASDVAKLYWVSKVMSAVTVPYEGLLSSVLNDFPLLSWCLKLGLDYVVVPVVTIHENVISWTPQSKFGERFAVAAVGYFVIGLAVAMVMRRLEKGCSQVNPLTGGYRSVYVFLLEIVSTLTVMAIFGIELFLFPIFCGFQLDVVLAPVLGPAEYGFLLSSQLGLHPIPFQLGIGTIFMYLFASFVSMARSRILRKGVLFFIRSPDDPNVRLVHDALMKPFGLQVSRIALSGVVYTGYILVEFALITWGLRYLSPVQILPLKFSTISLISSAIVFRRALCQDVAVRAFRWYWNRAFELSCSWLRLSSFILGHDVPHERGAVVYGNVFYRFFSKDEPDYGNPVPAFMTTQFFKENPSETCCFVPDGTFVRAPDDDNVSRSFIKNLFVPVTKDDKLLAPVQERDDDEARFNPYGDDEIVSITSYTIVYRPPQFKWRIFGFLFCLWFFSIALGLVVFAQSLLCGKVLGYLVDTFLLASTSYRVGGDPGLEIDVTRLSSGFCVVLLLTKGFELLRGQLRKGAGETADDDHIFAEDDEEEDPDYVEEEEEDDEEEFEDESEDDEETDEEEFEAEFAKSSIWKRFVAFARNNHMRETLDQALNPFLVYFVVFIGFQSIAYVHLFCIRIPMEGFQQLYIKSQSGHSVVVGTMFLLVELVLHMSAMKFDLPFYVQAWRMVFGVVRLPTRELFAQIPGHLRLKQFQITVLVGKCVWELGGLNWGVMDRTAQWLFPGDPAGYDLFALNFLFWTWLVWLVAKSWRPVCAYLAGVSNELKEEYYGRGKLLANNEEENDE